MLLGKYAYDASRKLHREIVGAGFYVILLAAARVADGENFARLQAMWPDVMAELQERYDAPGGELTEEREAQIEAMPRPPV
jgi:hypothetical protein